MLQVRPNSRQIPRLKDYTADKHYDDLLYGYLQLVSLPHEDGSRYVDAKEVSFVKLAERFGITRQTLSSRFKGLQHIGLVGQKEKGSYDLHLLSNEAATLVPLDVLEAIVDNYSSHMLSLYVYFLGRYVANKEQKVSIVLATMKSQIGVSANTYSNSPIIKEATDRLIGLGLIDYYQGPSMYEGKFVTIQLLNSVTNKLL